MTDNIDNYIDKMINNEIIMGDAINTELDNFEEILIYVAKNKKIDSKFKTYLEVFIDINDELKNIYNKKELNILINNKKKEEENIKNLYNQSSKNIPVIKIIQDNILYYDKYIKNILSIKLNEDQKYKIINKLINLEPNINFNDINLSMENMKNILKDIDNEVNNSNLYTKDILIVISAIMILFKNIYEHMKCI
jgi:hypothetical protein